MSCAPWTGRWPRCPPPPPLRPEAAHYEGAAEHLQDVWVAVRASLRNVLERVSLEDVVAGRLPRTVAKLTEDPDAWSPHH